MEGPQILWKDNHNVVARWRNVLIQVRRGDLSMEALENIVATARSIRLSVPGPVGALAIVEATAAMPGKAVRDRQTEMFKQLLEDQRVHVATAVLGEGITAMLKRTVARAILTGHPRIKMFSSEDGAVTHLAKVLGHDKAELESALAQARQTP